MLIKIHKACELPLAKSILSLSGIKSYTRFWGLLMFGSYSVINVIVLLNLLIAMMSNSYAVIEVRFLMTFVIRMISSTEALMPVGTFRYGVEIRANEVMDELL